MSETMSTSGIKDDDDTKDEESELLETTPEREQFSKHSDSSVKNDGLSIADRQRTDSRDADVSLRVKYCCNLHISCLVLNIGRFYPNNFLHVIEKEIWRCLYEKKMLNFITWWGHFSGQSIKIKHFRQVIYRHQVAKFNF